MSKILQLNPALCTGCSCCQQICPKGCIAMAENREGFLLPTIDQQQCVDCGLCAGACPVISPENRSHTPVAYAAKAKDEAIRSASSSGGIFSLVAESVLTQGGVVFGAGFDEAWNVVHMAVQRREDLSKLRGSKYVQSRIGNAFRLAKNYLDEGRPVLFTGTPCQIEGLLKFLRQPYDNLITQDIICHGVPSPLAWQKYVQQMEKRFGAPVCHVNFRHKSPNWRSYSIQLQFQNGKRYESLRSKDPFMQSFLKDLTLRPSCYRCTFKKIARVSDFTLADFWGIQHCIPEMDDEKGTSLVICHTEKAKALLDKLADHIIFTQADLEAAVKHNMAMCQSAPCPAQRDAFMAQIETEPFNNVVHRHCKLPSLPVRILRKAVRILKKLMKRG